MKGPNFLTASPGELTWLTLTLADGEWAQLTLHHQSGIVVWSANVVDDSSRQNMSHSGWLSTMDSVAFGVYSKLGATWDWNDMGWSGRDAEHYGTYIFSSN